MDPHHRQLWKEWQEKEERRRMQDHDDEIRRREQEDWVRQIDAREREEERQREMRHAATLWRGQNYGCFCGVGPDWRPRKDCPEHGHEAEPTCGVCSFNFYSVGQGGVASELVPDQDCLEHQAEWESKQEEERVAREQAAEQSRKDEIERKNRQEEERKRAEREQAQKKAQQAAARAKAERRAVVHWIIASLLTILALPFISIPLIVILGGLVLGIQAISDASAATMYAIAGLVVVPLALYAVFWVARFIKEIIE